MNQNALSDKNKINSRAKSNPFKRTGLQVLFYKPEWEVSAFRSIKLYKND